MGRGGGRGMKAASPEAVKAEGTVVGENGAPDSWCTVAGCVREILCALGEDPRRPGVQDTPARVARAMLEGTEGHRLAGGVMAAAQASIGAGVFREECPDWDEEDGCCASVVSVEDVETYALDAQSLLPLRCIIGVSYRSRHGVVLGLSKVARVANASSARLSSAAALAEAVGSSIWDAVEPLGLAVRVDSTEVIGTMQDWRTCVWRRGKEIMEPDTPSSLHQTRDAGECATGVEVSASSSGAGDPLDGTEGSDVREEGKVGKCVVKMLDELAPDLSRKERDAAAFRYAKFLLFSTRGYCSEIPTFVPLANGASQEPREWHATGIPVRSLCEHHLLPFHGVADIAYVASGRCERRHMEFIVATISQRLQMQERLTKQIATAVESALRASGVLVHIKCYHMCMKSRGVRAHASKTVTVASKGCLNGEPGRSGTLRALRRSKLKTSL